MGNYRFKLSDMMPNVWFKKLRNMSRVGNHHNSPPSKKKKQQTSASATQPSKPKQSHQYDPRKSYYFSRDQLNPSDGYHISPTNPKSSEKLFSDTPRKSSKQRVSKRTSRSSPKLVTSVSADCRCRAGAVVESVCTKSDSPPEFSSSPFGSSPETDILEPEFRSDGILATESCDGLVSWSSTYGRKAMSKADDIVIEVVNKPFSATFEKPYGFDNSLSELQLPPIITKREKSNDLKKTETKEPTKYGRRNSAKLEESRITMKEQRTSPSKRFSGTSPGVKLRINSPRIASTRKSIQTHNRRSFMSTSRKSFSDSFAVVKSSSDPQRDFRDSMVEMIVEKNIKSSKDLEDLLACYLSLNSDEYHDLIIEVFKQIWFDLTDRPK